MTVQLKFEKDRVVITGKSGGVVLTNPQAISLAKALIAKFGK